MKLIILISFLTFPCLFYFEAPAYTGEIPCSLTFYSQISQEKGGKPFTYQTDCELAELEVEVFNQWGENIYGTSDLNLEWFGKTTNLDEKGNLVEKNLKQGTYYYIAKYKFKGSETIQKQGGSLRINL